MAKRFGADEDKPVELEFELSVYNETTDEERLELFKLRRQISPAKMKELGSAKDLDPAEADIGDIVWIWDVVLTVESSARFKAIMESDDEALSIKEMMLAFPWAMEQIFGRPTMRQPGSSEPSPSEAGTGSEEPASPPATAPTT